MESEADNPETSEDSDSSDWTHCHLPPNRVTVTSWLKNLCRYREILKVEEIKTVIRMGRMVYTF